MLDAPKKLVSLSDRGTGVQDSVAVATITALRHLALNAVAFAFDSRLSLKRQVFAISLNDFDSEENRKESVSVKAHEEKWIIVESTLYRQILMTPSLIKNMKPCGPNSSGLISVFPQNI